MTIKREIDGKEFEFELLDLELMNAYDEMQHRFDVENVDSYFCWFSDDELLNAFQITRDEVMDLYDDIAYEMRRNIDKYDMNWEYARDEAVNDVLLAGRVVMH